ncbi:MAG: hypothetical protein KC680_04375 [Candidatus Peregrinibacteria bacterium]|nr:hypothetical protein [Candidatus Peregrinibacteria bacterium]MCB9808468.1 hypothetical protein [Candidatus Peribacteria bacterium]
MTAIHYKPDDFVYVDPDAKKAIGLVEWDKDGNPVAKEWPYPEIQKQEQADDKKHRRPRKKKVRYYPWGSYHTMCKLYKLEGKVKDKEVDSYITLDTAIGNLQENPFWD